VHYHPGKANVVADALSRKSHFHAVQPLFEDGFNLMHPAVLYNIQISYTLESKIIEGQKIDKGIFYIKEKMKKELTKHFRVDEQGVPVLFHLRTENSKFNLWIKLIFLSYLSILELAKCIKN
jgi:uncharacterized membrane-anchored protein